MLSRQKQLHYDRMQTDELVKAKCNNAKRKMLSGKNNEHNTCPIMCK